MVSNKNSLPCVERSLLPKVNIYQQPMSTCYDDVYMVNNRNNIRGHFYIETHYMKHGQNFQDIQYLRCFVRVEESENAFLQSRHLRRQTVTYSHVQKIFTQGYILCISIITPRPPLPHNVFLP